MNQSWFEFSDLVKKNYSKSVWIPLRASLVYENTGEYGHEGFKEIFFGCGSIAIPSDQINEASNLGWQDIGLINHQCGYIEGDDYIPADSYVDYRSKLKGVHLALEQMSSDNRPCVWHLNQDFAISLGLFREEDQWLCPDDGYEIAVRLKRNKEGRPSLLECKAQYLRDYLCARGMHLCIATFNKRELVTKDPIPNDWTNSGNQHTDGPVTWQGSCDPIHKGGKPFGAKMAVFHMSRNDVDASDDIPDISSPPTNENTDGSSWEKSFEGEKLYRTYGELWKTEFIEPASISPRIRKDASPPTSFFITNAEGTRQPGPELIHSGLWLWFRPDVVPSLSERRCGSLEFHTAQTGTVSGSYGTGVHFGINDLGLVNVYAKDIGLLPEWLQQVWAGHNIPPDGGVSEELLASQVNAKPAQTMAPESCLGQAIAIANQTSQECLGIKLFRDHDHIPEILQRTHRFRSLSLPSLFSLAKDVARLTADSLDASAMQTITPPPKGTQWGSLKSLEKLIAQKYGDDKARKHTAPLVGIYDLRLADAHLPKSDLDNAFDLIGIDQDQPFVHQGFRLLHQAVSVIYTTHLAIKNWKEVPDFESK